MRVRTEVDLQLIDCDHTPMNTKVMDMAMAIVQTRSKIFNKPLPPIKLGRLKNGRYKLLDGSHRVAAHRICKIRYVPAQFSVFRMGEDPILEKSDLVCDLQQYGLGHRAWFALGYLDYRIQNIIAPLLPKLNGTTYIKFPDTGTFKTIGIDVRLDIRAHEIVDMGDRYIAQNKLDDNADTISVKAEDYESWGFQEMFDSGIDTELEAEDAVTQFFLSPQNFGSFLSHNPGKYQINQLF